MDTLGCRKGGKRYKVNARGNKLHKLESEEEKERGGEHGGKSRRIHKIIQVIVLLPFTLSTLDTCSVYGNSMKLNLAWYSCVSVRPRIAIEPFSFKCMYSNEIICISFHYATYIAKPKTYTQNELNGLWFFPLWQLGYETTSTIPTEWASYNANNNKAASAAAAVEKQDAKQWKTMKRFVERRY